jgi:hypothetical protein
MYGQLILDLLLATTLFHYLQTWEVRRIRLFSSKILFDWELNVIFDWPFSRHDMIIIVPIFVCKDLTVVTKTFNL